MKNYFPRLLGNDKAKDILGTAIENGTLPHALLIDGPDGSGKTTLALEVAAALNCTGNGALPCGECENCRRIYSGEYVDVKILSKPADKASLGVNEIKETFSGVKIEIK